MTFEKRNLLPHFELIKHIDGGSTNAKLAIYTASQPKDQER